MIFAFVVAAGQPDARNCASEITSSSRDICVAMHMVSVSRVSCGLFSDRVLTRSLPSCRLFSTQRTRGFFSEELLSHKFLRIPMLKLLASASTLFPLVSLCLTSL